MKNLKRILLLQALMLWALTLNADDDCPCDGGTADYSVDCDGDETMDACSTDDCPDPTISGPEYVEKNESVLLSASGTKSPYTWSVSSGSSYVSLTDNGDGTTDVEGASEGAVTVEVTDVHGNTNTHDITCFSVEIQLGSHSTDDGIEDIDIDIIVEPSSIESEISSVTLEGKKPGGSTAFDNPDGAGIEIIAKSSNLEWKIKVARWWSDSSLDCVDDQTDYFIAEYVIGGTYQLGGSQYDFDGADFEVWVSEEEGVSTDRWHSHDGQDGRPNLVSMVSTEFVTIGLLQYWEATIDTTPMAREVEASYVPLIPFASQFFDMIIDEEDHHVAQLENSVDGIIDPLSHYSVSNVHSEVNGEKRISQVGGFHAQALALNHLSAIVDVEQTYSAATIYNVQTPGSIRCELEKAAKQAVGSDYYLTYECAYASSCN